MATKIDLNKLDRRLAERHIRKGELTQEAWDKHLESLPDVADQSETIKTELETGVIQGR
ncbi:hypothetical protein [Vulgatibacter sp.]|uniref:hypothetical protein n=1 Tax=Vulgatibacter sp. TaxID=1971226 RepID=UPI00356A9EB8